MSTPNVPRINLLPHREMKKAQRKRDFGVAAFMTIVAALAIVGVVGVVISGMISNQESRNTHLEKANKKLDEEIKEVASLRAEIEALRARQNAVEDLQADRNTPVQVLDELVKLTPEGIYLDSIKQATATKLEMTGVAQSQERVAEFLRNLTDAQYLNQPKLNGILAASTKVGKDQRKVFAFKLEANIKRAEKKSASGVTAADPASGVSAASAVGTSAASAVAARPATAVTSAPASAPPAAASAPAAPKATK